jgi:hypothetical protein
MGATPFGLAAGKLLVLVRRQKLYPEGKYTHELRPPGRQIHIEKKLHQITIEISFSSARHAA